MLWHPSMQVAAPILCSLPQCAPPAGPGHQQQQLQVQAVASAVQHSVAAAHPSSLCGQQLCAPPPSPPTNTTAPRLEAIRTRMQQCQHQRPATRKKGGGTCPTADIHLQSPLKGSKRALEHHLRELPPRHRHVLVALCQSGPASPVQGRECS
jgi:hypothetical protein